MYSPNEIASWFLHRIDREVGDAITPLKLQKLLYYAHAWSLALLDKPLFKEEFQAWTYGPVLRSIYKEHEEHRYEIIPAPDFKPILDPEVEALLEDIHRIYGAMYASDLTRLTHREEPWKQARGVLPPDAYSQETIPNHTIKEFYMDTFRREGGPLTPNLERFESQTPESTDDGQEWDDTLSSPQSIAFLENAAREAQAEFDAGETLRMDEDEAWR